MFDSVADDPPVERQVTIPLGVDGRPRSDRKDFVGDADAFPKTVERGVSANLCDAVATLIEPFGGIDIGLTWACTCTVETARETVRFGASDAPILAARRFREWEPRLDVIDRIGA